MPCEILVEALGRHEEVAGCRHGSQQLSRRLQRGWATESLRDIGYDFPAAVADIVDNSVMAGASHVDVSIEFAGEESYVVIADDGEGMTGNGLVEALRYGSRRSYGRSDLGRYGLGLKTASLSQCRSVTVVTCRRAAPGNVHIRMLDLDLIAEWDEWLVVEPLPEPVLQRSVERLASEPGTVVIWRKLNGSSRRNAQTVAGRVAASMRWQPRPLSI